MSHLKMTKKENTKPEAEALMSAVEKKFGFVPNLMTVLADSPATLQAYLTLSDLVGKSAFSPEEQQAILLAASAENGCEYCVAAHSMIAAKMAAMPADRLTAIRNNTEIADKKFSELVRFTRAVVSNRGFVGHEAVSRFLEAGYSNQHVLEVILGVAMKTLSNYANHMAETPVDNAFSAFAWTRK